MDRGDVLDFRTNEPKINLRGFVRETKQTPLDPPRAAGGGEKAETGGDTRGTAHPGLVRPEQMHQKEEADIVQRPYSNPFPPKKDASCSCRL